MNLDLFWHQQWLIVNILVFSGKHLKIDHWALEGFRKYFQRLNAKILMVLNIKLYLVYSCLDEWPSSIS